MSTSKIHIKQFRQIKIPGTWHICSTNGNQGYKKGQVFVWYIGLSHCCRICNCNFRRDAESLILLNKSQGSGPNKTCRLLRISLIQTRPTGLIYCTGASFIRIRIIKNFNTQIYIECLLYYHHCSTANISL